MSDQVSGRVLKGKSNCRALVNDSKNVKGNAKKRSAGQTKINDENSAPRNFNTVVVEQNLKFSSDNGKLNEVN